MRGLMAAVIAQATVDLVVGGAESAAGQEAERFLASAECRWMVEYLGWEYRWPWGPTEAVSDEL